MAFGKVVVRTEDGKEEIYELTKPTTSVGRQAGNDIVLKTTSASRYHAQFDVADGQVYLVDLSGVNGTFINDKQIEPGSRVELAEGDIVSLGDVLLEYFPRMVRASLNPPYTDTFTGPDLPFILEIEAPQQPVAPGARLQLLMFIENSSQDEILLSTDTDGLSREWVKINRRDMRLDPGEQTEVVVSVRPPRFTTTRPGIYALTVRIYVKDDPVKSIEVVREIDVVGYAGLGMAVWPSQRVGRYDLVVQNQGSEEIVLGLGGYQPNKKLRYTFNPHEVALAPGESHQIDVSVNSIKPVESGEKIPFAIVARSLDKSKYQAPLYAVYERSGEFPTWIAGLLGLPILALGGLAMLLIVAFFLTDGFFGAISLGRETPVPTEAAGSGDPVAVQPTALPTEPPPPTDIPPPTATPRSFIQIDSFTASDTVIEYGQTTQLIAFDWIYSGDADVRLFAEDEIGNLLIFGSGLQGDDGGSGRAEVTVDELVKKLGWSGPTYEHDFLLEVVGADGGGLLRQTVTVTVRPVDICRLSSPEVYESPNLNAVASILEDAGQVVIAGKLVDSELWVMIWDFEGFVLRGWVPISNLLCENSAEDIDSSLENYLTVGRDGIPLP